MSALVISREEIGSSTSEDLLWLEALVGSLACRGQVQFKGWKGITPDGLWDDRTPELVRDVTRQFLNSPREVLSDSLLSWLQSAIPLGVDELIEHCTPPEPAPEPPPVDQPDLIFDEPVVPVGDTTRKMVLINRSDASMAQAQKWVDAVNWQIENHVSKHYGGMEFRLSRNEAVRPGEWVHMLFTKPDGNYGGYHTKDEFGQPVAFSFTQSGLHPCVVISHEALEVLANFVIRLWLSLGGGRDAWYELCDAVQAIAYNAPNGEPVSDLVLPAWWGLPTNDPTILTATGRYYGNTAITRPGQIAPGGYMGVRNVSGSIDFVTSLAAGARTDLSPNRGPGCRVRSTKRCIDEAARVILGA